MDKVGKFSGDYDFLSNFYPCSVTYDGDTYQCSEGAFQAAKLLDRKYRFHFFNLDGKESKRLGKRVYLRDDWESFKDTAMYVAVKAKFTQNDTLKQKLLDTGDAYLEEGNYWNDTYWGVCKGTGKNMLGKTLMKVREELRND